MTLERDDPVRQDLKGLIRVVAEVHRQLPDLDLCQFLILLYVAVEPGITGKDVLSRLGTKKSTMSRNIRLLATSHYQKEEDGKPKPGLGLISQTQHPSDGRYYLLAPTRKLWTLAERLSHLMRG